MRSISADETCRHVGRDSLDIRHCFELSAAHIARYKDDKAAAASYTFDDGYSSSDRIAAIFESFGMRATFYIVADAVEERTGWDLWRALARQGHEVGNHSLTHTKNLSRWLLSKKTLTEEIDGAKELITAKLGIAPATFAFPWHKSSFRAMAIAQKSHFAVRKQTLRGEKYAFAFFDEDHAATPEQALLKANTQLSDIANTGGWFVAAGHGVDGDGWSPVTSQFLIDHLTHASKLSPALWIDTYANVARYRACRENTSLLITSLSPSKIIVQLQGGNDCGQWRVPLTVVMPIGELPGGVIRVRDAKGNIIAATLHSRALQFDLLPGAKASIEIA